jgi:beta-lactamase class A
MAISALRLRPVIKALAIAVSIGSLPFVYLQVDARDGHLNALNGHVNANVKAAASTVAVSPSSSAAARPSRSTSPAAQAPAEATAPAPAAVPASPPSVGHPLAPASATAQAPATSPAPSPPARSFDQLQGAVAAIVAASGARVAVSLIELGGANPGAWNSGGDEQFVAASTYKLPLLMEQSQQLAAGAVSGSDQLCFEEGDWEDGWYADYVPGQCFSRDELATRAAHASDNTAAHILVRYAGGGDELNAFARAHGASESAFCDPNSTTANDLARLMAAAERGDSGGAAAWQWLAPLLTHTNFETGIPAGVGAPASVAHKIGEFGATVDDVGLVSGAAGGAYVLAVTTDGAGGDAGFSLVAQISAGVWQFENGR